MMHERVSMRAVGLHERLSAKLHMGGSLCDVRVCTRACVCV